MILFLGLKEKNMNILLNIFKDFGDNFIRNRYNNSKNNYVNGGVTYDMQSKYELLDGDQKLEIKEMEVFQIKREDDMD
jgi:hypothetical protein